MENLYAQLKYAEKVNGNFQEAVESANRNFKRFKNVPGYFSIISEDIPKFNVEEHQKKIIKNYETNPILIESVKGLQSIEETFLELKEQKFKGIKKYLPKRKDKIHNQRVNNLDNLVGYTHLDTRGILFPDNFITAAIYGSAFLYGVFSLLAEPNEATEHFRNIFSPLGGIMVGGVFQLTGAPTPKIEEAKYLDSKLIELK